MGAAGGRRGRAGGMALRGGRAEPADERHGNSDDAEADGDLSTRRLASSARAQLAVVMRTINSSSEVAEASQSLRAVPEALGRGSAAAFTVMRAAPGVLRRMLLAARMSQEQLQTLCQRLGFHPGIAGMLYYSLQAASGAGAVCLLGFAVFMLQLIAGGISLLMSVLGGFGSTLLLGGAAGTAVVGGTVVVPAFVLSSGSAILVFIAGVATREGGRRPRRTAGSRRAARELPPRRVFELPSPADDSAALRERTPAADGSGGVAREGRDAGGSGRGNRRRSAGSRDDVRAERREAAERSEGGDEGRHATDSGPTKEEMGDAGREGGEESRSAQGGRRRRETDGRSRERREREQEPQEGREQHPGATPHLVDSDALKAQGAELPGAVGQGRRAEMETQMRQPNSMSSVSNSSGTSAHQELRPLSPPVDERFVTAGGSSLLSTLGRSPDTRSQPPSRSYDDDDRTAGHLAGDGGNSVVATPRGGYSEAMSLATPTHLGLPASSSSSSLPRPLSSSSLQPTPRASTARDLQSSLSQESREKLAKGKAFLL